MTRRRSDVEKAPLEGDSRYLVPPEVTEHALERFRERIEEISHDELSAVIAKAWKRRNHGKPEERTYVRIRKYKGKNRAYLCLRSPGGKPAYMALSEDRSAVLTVLDVMYWNFFVGTKRTPQAVERERIMEKMGMSSKQKGIDDDQSNRRLQGNGS